MTTHLTQGDRDALVRAVLAPDDDCAHNLAPLFETVERIVAGKLSNDALERDIRAIRADPVGRLGWPECKTTPGAHCVCRAGNPAGCARERAQRP